METYVKLRRRHLVKQESISSLARDLNLTRNTIKKYLRAEAEPAYHREQQPCPKLGTYRTQLETWLHQDSQRPKSQRRTARRLFQDLQGEGYVGAYDSVQRFVKQWKAQSPNPATDAFVPLSFPPGDTGQFDWSHEQVELGGVVQTLKLAHFRLAHSRQMFLAAYPRETQEMVFDAHNRAFSFFGGVPVRMVYDNPKTIVQVLYAGKARQFNRRFLALANHYLFEPVACTPASGWGEAGFRKACFALPQPARYADRAVGREARGRWRTRSATCGNGCSPPGPASGTWPNSTPGWRFAVGNWRNAPTPSRRNAPSPRCSPKSGPASAPSARPSMATSSSPVGSRPPVW